MTNTTKETAQTSLVILQSTNFCNLNCDYCYLPGRKGSSTMAQNMMHKIAEKLFEENVLSDPVTFCWHAGEPLTAGLEFYRKFTELLKNANKTPKKIHQNIQTNGILIDDAWCDFFIKNEFRISVSLDGPEKFHNLHRVNWKGKGTHKHVMKGIECLKKSAIPFSVISVLTPDSIQEPDQLYRFFKSVDMHSLGFNFEETESDNPVNSYQKSKKEESHLIEDYQNFFSRFYDLWLEDDMPFIVREFENSKNVLMSFIENPESTTNKGDEHTPFRILTISKNGHISTFSPELVTDNPDEFSIGHIDEINSFSELYSSEKLESLTNQINMGIEKCKKECDYFGVCGGGAPSNKYFENGRLDSSETMYCRFHKKALFDVLIGKLEPKTALLPGIFIHGLDDLLDKDPNSVLINSGTSSGQAFSHPELSYEDSAYIPKEDFLPLSHEQCQLLKDKTPGLPDRVISIIKIPEETLSSVKKIITDNIGKNLSVKDMKKDIIAHFNQTSSEDQLMRFIKNYMTTTESPPEKKLGLYCSKPLDSPTLTVSHSDAILVGLHVDSWDRMKVGARAHSRNRICINLGAEDRFLLFINLTISQIFQMTNITYRDKKYFQDSATLLAQAFMKQNPNYPVIKVKVRPGEAYIAPTENIIHDGVNTNQNSFDIAWTVLGSFTVSPQNRGM